MIEDDDDNVEEFVLEQRQRSNCRRRREPKRGELEGTRLLASLAEGASLEEPKEQPINEPTVRGNNDTRLDHHRPGYVADR